MIDNLDKQTQPLPLETKRGRGRPATGQALSNAERQRRYREAQKAQRNEKPATANHATVQALDQEVRKLLVQLEKATERAELAEAKCEVMGKELAKAKAKLSKAGPTKRRYVLQMQNENGTWLDDSTGDFGSKAKADAACKAMNEPGFSHAKWRVRERQWV